MGDYKTVSSVNGDLNIAFGLTIACLRDLTATSANNSGPTSYSAMYCCPAAPNQRTGTGTAGAGYVKYRNACLENVVDRMLTTASIAIHIAGIGLLISSVSMPALATAARIALAAITRQGRCWPGLKKRSHSHTGDMCNAHDIDALCLF